MYRPNRETTALLAAVTELLVDEPAEQLRCRHALAERDEHLPKWMGALSQVDVYRAVRVTDVLGDADEVVIGMRLDGAHELSVVVVIDHVKFSRITDAGALPDAIDDVLARVAESDTDVVEMSLADARAWVEDALAEPTFAPESESWAIYRPLIKWVLSRLPEGGEHRTPVMDWEATAALCDSFFASDSAAPFTDYNHRQLLLELLDDDRDPLRWSAARVRQAIGDTPCYDDYIPLEVALDAPDLLRAFIPYVHAQSGIRDELTSRVLAVVDELRSSYKREVLREAHWWDLDDAV
ncbi:hypothetical protein ACRCUN_29290 [Mycobacterium sp. LTG2003]